MCQNEASNPLVCNVGGIPASQRHRYELLTNRLRSATRVRAELEDGYSVSIDGGTMPLQEVAEWVSLERCCCPFLTFVLEVPGRADEWALSLQGPAGVKAILAVLIRLAIPENSTPHPLKESTTTRD